MRPKPDRLKTSLIIIGMIHEFTFDAATIFFQVSERTACNTLSLDPWFSRRVAREKVRRPPEPFPPDRLTCRGDSVSRERSEAQGQPDNEATPECH
jgi:hypothetical protein